MDHRPRPLLTAAAGLVVAVLLGGAFALTYDLLREFALAGRASRRWAPVYPVMADALVVMTILSLIVARNAPWWSRWLRGALLLLLVSGTAAIAVQHALWGFTSLPADPVRAGVAVAPHIMLIIAVWLWFRMIKHLRPTRSTPAPQEPAPKPTPPPLALDPTDAAPEPNTTQPDMIMPVTLDKHTPKADEQDEDEEDEPDPTETTGIDTSADLPIWDWDPPSGSVRSSPTPPTD
ncbi:DUF2637 domain-containing protein [Actinomadura rugatobispora]|uniref:DUF2637 domain-containing protein n=1 Tax=Actinomadura rugatobispora TaxID=1994 RepID=A0ABW1ADC0_9ACTN|nr:hypothetical protein GCM10010200_051860 [Actinomadura rugatobispora]